MNPSALIIPDVIQSIHNSTHNAETIRKAVDRGDESDESPKFSRSCKMQTVGKWVCSP
jgi:hypothetical protein